MTAATAEGMAVGFDQEPRCVAVPAHAATELGRVHSQLGEVIAMLEVGRSRTDIVTHLAAASKALSRTGFTIIAAGLHQCIDPSDGPGGRPPELTVEQLEKLLLSLA